MKIYVAYSQEFDSVTSKFNPLGCSRPRAIFFSKRAWRDWWSEHSVDSKNRTWEMQEFDVPGAVIVREYTDADMPEQKEMKA